MNFFNAYALFYILCFKICYNPCLLTYSWGKIFRNNLHFMIWFEYFDPVKVYVKVQPYLRTSRHKQIRIGAFQRGNISQLWSRGFKVTSLKCWQSRKKWDTLDSRLHFLQVYIVNLCSSGNLGWIPRRYKVSVFLQAIGLHWVMLAFWRLL